MAGDQADQLRRMRGVLVPLDSTPKRRVIAVTGGKGGVGKSTVSVNLAVSYASRGARTLAFDGDMGMADLNLLLGLAPEHSMADLLDGRPVDDVLASAHGIHLLPALNGSFRLANLGERDRAQLLAALESLADRFDTLIVDIPAGIGENAVALAGSAAEIVVVATPEPLSLADAYACLKALTRRERITRAFVLPNNVRSPSEAEEIYARLSTLVSRFLGITLLPLPAVPHDPMVAHAAAAGVPLVLHSPDSPASRGIRQVARRIDALAEPSARPGGLRGFLRNAVGGSR